MNSLSKIIYPLALFLVIASLIWTAYLFFSPQGSGSIKISLINEHPGLLLRHNNSVLSKILEENFLVFFSLQGIDQLSIRLSDSYPESTMAWQKEDGNLDVYAGYSTSRIETNQLLIDVYLNSNLLINDYQRTEEDMAGLVEFIIYQAIVEADSLSNQELKNPQAMTTFYQNVLNQSPQRPFSINIK